MYYLIIGYGNFTKALINFLTYYNKTVFILDNKPSNSININNKNVFYLKRDITNMKLLMSEVKKSTILKVYICTDDDYLNLMIADNICKLKDTTVLFTSTITKNIKKKEYDSLFISNILENFLIKENSIC